MSISNSNDSQSNVIFNFVRKFSKNISVLQLQKKRSLPAWILLTGGLLLTLTVCLISKADTEKNAKTEFAFACNELGNKISARLHSHAQLLQSGAAFFEHSDTITRDEWRNYYVSQKIEKNMPGIQGIGYSVIIPPDQLALHEKKIQSEGYPQYSVRPAGKRGIYTSIIYLEPFSGRNLRAFGYDMFSEPVRRKVMETARDSNIADISGKITLIQETNEDIQAGTLMFVPVYKKGMPVGTVEERRHAIKGWVYSPYRMDDMMAGILGGYETIKEKHIHLKIFDDSSYRQNSLLYDSKKVINKDITSSLLFSLQTSISFNNHQWYLLFMQHSSRVSGLDYSKIWYIAAGGTIISLLLFVLYISLINTNIMAHKLAEELIRDLRESEAKYKTIFNNEIYAISIFDLKTYKFLDVNEAHCSMYGYSREEFLSGMSAYDITSESHASFSSIEQVISQGSIFIPLRYHKKKDGTVFPVEIVGGIYTWKGKKVLFALVHDITERTVAEEQLKQWQHIFENAKWGIVVGDAKADFLGIMNPAFAEMHGWTVQELIGKPIFSVFAPESRNEIRTNIEKAHQRGHYFWESRHIRRDGTIFPVLIDITTVKDEKGNILYRVVNVQDITEHKQAEEAIETLALRNQILLQTASDGIHILDDQGDVVEVNEAFCRMLGYTREELLRLNVADWDTQWQNEELLAKVRELIKNPDIFITQHRRKDGSSIYVEINGSGITLEGRLYLYASARDITERRQVENALRESEQNYRTLADSGHILVWVAGTDKFCYYFNRIWLEFTGRTLEQEMGNGWTEGVHPEDLQHCLNGYITAFDRWEKFSMDYCLRRYDGQYRWIQDDGAPRYNSEGEFIGYIGQCYDITERKQAVAALALRNQILMQTASDGIYILDVHGNIVEVNMAFCTMLGYTREELLRLNVADWDMQYPVDELLLMIRELIQSPGMFTTQYRRRDGSFLDVEINGTGIMLDDRQCFYASTRDITVRKQAEFIIQQQNNQLKELNASKTKLFSIIAHDLKGPFHGFLGLTQSMAEQAGNFSAQELSEYGKIMYQTASNIFKLLKNLLEWARMQNGTMIFHAKEFSLSGMVAESIETMKGRSKQKGITLTNSVAGLVDIYADENMVRSVILNLLSNAIKFTHRDGTVTISINETAGQMIETAVSDTGVGMSQDVIERLFKIGEKIGSKGTDGEMSTGLGLLLCKEFVEKHGGKIWVESGKGKGTTFYFTLPATNKNVIE
ncbi:MAG: PAS domain S-box protein [Ignavibacteria bacterium]